MAWYGITRKCSVQEMFLSGGAGQACFRKFIYIMLRKRWMEKTTSPVVPRGGKDGGANVCPTEKSAPAQEVAAAEDGTTANESLLVLYTGPGPPCKEKDARLLFLQPHN